MEKTLKIHFLSHGFNCDNILREKTKQPSSIAAIANNIPHIHLQHSSNLTSFQANKRGRLMVEVGATRRARILHDRTETYVLIEPGEEEKFVSEEELKAKLKGYLENWQKPKLPPDLARFETIDEAVSFLVGSVCELEIDGDAGSVQWYRVRLD